MKQTAVEWLLNSLDYNQNMLGIKEIIDQAKEMEKKQIFLALNQSAKEAYKSGQKTMNCGCYEISDATTYEEWLYEQFKEQ
jgi:predicted Zn-ribbon and HTH transcriptional regulator